MTSDDPEYLRPKETPSDYEVRNALIEKLSEFPIYADNAPIVQYVESRLSRLYEGESEEPPKVYVRDSPELNAVIIDDYLILDAGIFEHIEFEEELCALLSHEAIHIHEDHVKQERAMIDGEIDDIEVIISEQEKPRKKQILFNDKIKSVGVIRVQEIEADLRGMLRLDAKGINPRGMVSLCEKMQQFADEQKKGGSRILASPTHGHDNERAVNLEQAAWLFDMPNLSPMPLTPLSLMDKEEFGELQNSAESPDLLVEQASLVREIREGQDVDIDYDLLQTRQAGILHKTDPNLTPAEAQRLSKVALLKYYDGSPFEDLPTKNDVEQILRDLKHPSLLRAVGSFNEGKKFNIGVGILTPFIKRVEIPSDFPQILNIVEKTFPMQEVWLTTKERIEGQHVFEAALLKTAKAKGKDEIDRLFRKFAPVLAQGITPIFTAGSNNPAFSYAVAKRRYEAAGQCADFIDFLAYLSRYFDANEASVIKSILNDDFRTDVKESEYASWGNLIEYNGDVWMAHRYMRGRVTEGVKGPSPSDTVGERLRISSFQLKPAKLAAMLNDTQMSYSERRSAALLWASEYAKNHESTVKDHLNLIPLLFKYVSTETFSGFIADLMERHTVEQCTKIYNDKNLKGFEIQEPQFYQGVNFRLNDSVGGIFSSVVNKLKGIRLNDSSPATESIVMTLLRESPKIKDFATIAALETLAAKGDVSQLIELMQVVTPSRLGLGGGMSQDFVYEYASDCLGRAISKVLHDIDIDDETTLRTLVGLGICAEDVEINLHVSGSALARLVEQKSFAEGVALVFDEYSHFPAHILQAAITMLLEEKAQTKSDFELLDSVMKSHLQHFVQDNAEEIGVGSVIETNIIDALKPDRAYTRQVGIKYDDIKAYDPVAFMRALLMSAQTDRELKSNVFARWWELHRTSGVTGATPYFEVESSLLTLRYPNKAQRLEAWVNELPPVGSYTSLETTLDSLYLANDVARFVAVRKLMLGENGILVTEQGRASLVEAFMQSWLSVEEDSPAQAMLKTLMTSLMDSGSPERVYQYIGPVLQDLILRPPNETSSNADIAKAKAEEIMQVLVERRKTSRVYGNEVPALTNKILNLISGKPKFQAVELKPLYRQLRGLFPESLTQEFVGVTPVELALMTGKKSGALGVRMLQLAGQYYDISEEEQPKFNEVYDSLKGQTRLQAFKVLKNVAEHNHAVAEFLENIAHFGQRVGGGSLMTVYAVTMKDGSKEVAGVRNPNAEYHVIKIAELVEKTLEGAIAKTEANADLELARVLLTDAVQWIRDELNDTEFNQKDAVFRQENDTVEGDGFRKGRSKYELYIPKATPTNSLRIRREEFVAGVNLNGVVVVDGPTAIDKGEINQADFKEVVSVLVRNAFFQINNGRYIHSDVHKGNFRLTEDHKIAVFDRYNLIPVTDDLRTTLQQALSKLATGDRKSAVEAVVQGITPDDTAVSSAIIEQIAAEIESEYDVSKAVGKTVVSLKKAGLHVPIHLSLILRNIFSLSQLSEKAGFPSLLMAYLHTADDTEIAQIMQQ